MTLRSKKHSDFIYLAIIAVLGFIAYSNSLSGPFVWDDDCLVKNNVYIKHWYRAPEIFLNDQGVGSGIPYGYYRPVQILSYALDHALWGLQVHGYHLVNTFLHIIAAILLYFFIKYIFGDSRLSFLASLFFAVHPVNSEAVMYISSRGDLLALVFMLASFILYLKAPAAGDPFKAAIITACYLAALCSKENSLILILLLLLYHLTFRTKIKKKPFLSMALAAFFYVFLRLFIIRSSPPSDTMNMAALIKRLPGIFAAIPEYLRLMVMPFGLHMRFGAKVFSFYDPAVLFGIMLTAALIYAAVKMRSNRTIFFSIMWFLIALLPVANIYPLAHYMGERYLYLPAIGFFIVLGYLINSMLVRKNLKTAAVILIIFLTASYSYLTIRQGGYWKDLPGLYKKTLSHDPANASILSDLGTFYKDAGEYNKAISIYKTALKISPDSLNADNGLASIYTDLGHYDEAMTIYKRLMKSSPDYFTYCNMGVLYTRLGEYSTAAKLFRKAISLNHNNVTGYNNLAAVSMYMNDYDGSIRLYKKSIELDPDYAITYINLAMTYYHRGDRELAVRYSDRAKALGYDVDPNFLKAIGKQNK